MSFPSSTSAWQSNTLGAGATGILSTTGSVAGSSMRSRTYSSGLATTATANQSYFTKSSDIINPLPVHLISFTASAKQCDILVSFSTGVETNIKHYRLENSTDGSHFSTIATLSPKGNNSEYSYLHQHPTSGNNYYRLIMEDLDGTYTVSAIVTASADCGGVTSVSVYPNPATTQITITGMSGVNTQIRILNLHGQVAQTISTLNKAETLDISQLPTANYVIQVVENGTITLNEKLVKM
jgi:hypothetical protein